MEPLFYGHSDDQSPEQLVACPIDYQLFCYPFRESLWQWDWNTTQYCWELWLIYTAWRGDSEWDLDQQTMGQVPDPVSVQREQYSIIRNPLFPFPFLVPVRVPVPVPVPFPIPGLGPVPCSVQCERAIRRYFFLHFEGFCGSATHNKTRYLLW